MDELTELELLRSSVQPGDPESKENARILLEAEIESKGHKRRRKYSKFRRKVKVGLSLGALLAVVAFSPAGAAISDRAGELFGGPQSNPAFTGKVSEADLARLSVLRSDPMLIGDLPAPLDHALSSVLGPDEETNIRFGTVDTGRERVGVAGNHHGVCLTDALDGDGGTVCNTTADVLAGLSPMTGVCEAGLADGKVRALGLVPDGISEIQLRAADNGKIKTVKVRSNVYETDLWPKQYELTGADSLGRSIHIPLELQGTGLEPGETCAR